MKKGKIRRYGKKGKIKKFGKLIIEEDRITFTGFHTKYDSLHEFREAVLEWAGQRIEEEIDNSKPFNVISVVL